MEITADLSPFTIVVTRPAHQPVDFCGQLRHAGASVIYYPTIDLSSGENRSGVQGLIDDMDNLDILLFGSPNAVAQALALIHASRRLPPELTLGATGPSTARELEKHGYRAGFLPAFTFNGDTNGELSPDMPDMTDVHGKRIVILRATGGKSFLGNTLVKRGARVEYVQVHEGAPISKTQASLLMETVKTRIDIVTITSVDAFWNLLESLDEAALDGFRDAVFLVGNNKIAAAVRQMGFGRVVIATDPTNRSMLRALEQWMKTDKLT